MSFVQERFWFLDQMSPGSPAYNIPIAYRLMGSLDLIALEKSLTEMQGRHQTLRTTFSTRGEQAVQVIHPVSPATLSTVDLRHLPRNRRWPKAQELAVEEARRPFDLAGGPLWRATLMLLGEEEHLLLFNQHQIIFDGWSCNIQNQELGALYKAFSCGTLSPLPELPIQYADYSRREREELHGEALETQLSYWRQQLQDSPPALEWPNARPRPVRPRHLHPGATQSLELPRSLYESLQGLAAQEGCTLFMTLFAGFNSLLCRYTSSEDILMGMPIANRNRPETRGLIGRFVNDLVLRTDLSGNPTFRELLARVRQVTLGAYAHQDLPFEKLVEDLQPPQYQVALVAQPPISTPELPGIEVSRVRVNTGMAKHELTLQVAPKDQGLRVDFEYDTDLFDRGTITRMLDHFQSLLGSIVANPDQPISDLPMLAEAERHQLLVEWNNTKTDYPQGQCVHQLFEAQAERTPEALAVVCEGERLTYGDLNRRANQLAQHLRAMGVGPEVLVGIYMDRRPDIVVAILGVLKAGGAYVPLDPADPEERLAFILEDAQVSVLLTHRLWWRGCPLPECQVVFLDSYQENIAHLSESNPTSDAKDENLAYVIYTSGSTGKPNGVEITHKALLNTLYWLQETFDIGPGDVIAQKTSSGLTDSVWEYFWPLVAGAMLTIINEDSVRDPYLLYRCLSDGDVTVTQFVPLQMAAFLETVRREGESDPLPRLKWVFNGGEALPVTTAQEWCSLFPHAKIANIYGMTESAIFATNYIVQKGPEDGELGIPIGKPIANTQVYILDNYGQLCPVNVKGEICIGGVSMARGYLNRPELTAEKFITDPFNQAPGARLYKTGDLGRFLADGNIEYLGRLDRRVKMRGLRIELGEIEANIGRHPRVRGNVVMVREDVVGDQRLVAYLVGDPEAGVTSQEIRNFLKEQLPQYMIPSTFVMLNRLPLNPNGKVVRKELPIPDPEGTAPNEHYLEPISPMESLIANIWQDLLGLDCVGKYDNFFDLGGHSLLAMTAIRRLERDTGVRLNATEMIAQTLGQLASTCEGRSRTSGRPISLIFRESLLTVVKRLLPSRGR